MDLVVYGAGGHGRVVAEAARDAGFNVLGFIDDGRTGTVSGWPVLGGRTWLLQHVVMVAHGVGSNDFREKLQYIDRTFPAIIHPSAVVSTTAILGAGTVVLARAVINAGAVINRGAIINTGAVVEHDAVVGSFAHVASLAGLAGGAKIGQRVLVGSGATIMLGRTVGADSVVGAGAVVVHDVPDRVVVVGVPAKQKGA